jgi:DNA-binding response OmpR family regulator
MKRIFLVEDDKAIAKNLILLLRSEGFIVTHTPTRGDAIVALAENKFDLALIDISLPDGNGFTVCTQIKATQEIPVIFLTAFGGLRALCRYGQRYCEKGWQRDFPFGIRIPLAAGVY